METVGTNLVEEAIRIAGGSERKLAERCEVSQTAINKAKKCVAAGGQVSVEMAVRIDKATDGRVTRHMLRPDVFEPPVEAAE